MQTDALPAEVFNTLALLSSMGSSLSLIEKKVDDYAKENNVPKNGLDIFKAVPAETVRESRQEISNNITLVSRTLTKYYKNDARLHKPLMNFLSVLHFCVEYLDKIYRAINNKKELNGELGNIRDEVNSEKYMVKVGDKKARFTPGHYESYIQIYKSPAAAVDAYSKYLQLQARLDRNEKLSGRDKDEYEKLKKIEDLAKQFDNAHNYMLEKDNYKQQDIDYVFQLRMNEKKGGVESAMREDFKSSSGIYMSLIMEKIFGGMKNRFMKEGADGGISEADAGNTDKFTLWIDNEMDRSLSRKEDEMEMVIRGIKRAPAKPNEQKLESELFDVIQQTWLNRIFPDSDVDQKLISGSVMAPAALANIMGNDESAFYTRLKRLISMVMKENPQNENTPIIPE